MTWESLAERLAECSMSPLWLKLAELVTEQPRGRTAPHRWDYAEVRAAVLEAGELISTEAAERRVLVLENPGLQRSQRVTSSLYGGVQLVLPGEVARSHRHSQSAFRLSLEGDGAYTIVDGHTVQMHPGDLVLTPAMASHEHGNCGSTPALWLDGLDIPIVALFDASFAESQPSVCDARRDRTCATADPLFEIVPRRPTLPPVHYPFAAMRAALEQAWHRLPPDPYEGHKLRYVGRCAGGNVAPTMSAFCQWLSPAFRTRPRRSTDATVYVVLDGAGSTRVGDREFAWKSKDIFVAPSWAWVQHEADRQSILFSYSDRAAQEALGLWREERRA